MPVPGVGDGGFGQLTGVESFVREQPYLVAGAVVAALFLVSLFFLLRRVRRSDGARLASALERCNSVTVLMHPNPDPDAMACAVAVGLIAERVGTHATLQYPGEIRHQENRAFETVLDLSLERVASKADIVGEEVVAVDHGEPRGFAGAGNVTPYAVVDHHPDGGEATAFTDVRPDVGACSSIVAGYFQDLGWEPVDPDEDPSDDEVPPWVATGLVYGIQTDTKALTRGCSPLDFDASAYLHPGVDEDVLDRIGNPQVSADVLDIKARAITSREVRGPFAISDLGSVSNVDAIPQAADELLSLEGVSAVVVTGDHDGVLHLSGRSRDDRVHMGKTIAAVLEEFPDSSAGGHARMGGGQCDIESLNGTSRDAITDRMFGALAGER